MFYKKVSQYLQEKKPVLESLFNKIAALNAFCEYCEIFKNTSFSENLQTAASEHFFWGRLSNYNLRKTEKTAKKTS